VNVEQLRAMLVPLEEHPARELIDLEFGVEKLAAEPMPIPWGMVWNPASCQNYLEIAIPNLYSNPGWIRATDRRNTSFTHERFYLDMVINVPGRVDVNRIREAAGTCRSGTLTLDYKVTGRVTYTEIQPDELRDVRDGDTLAFRIEISFDAPRDEEELAVLTKYRYAQGAGGSQLFEGNQGVANAKEVAFAVSGQSRRTLSMVMSPEPGLAPRIVATMHQRALENGIR